jgi:hypothetical protein
MVSSGQVFPFEGRDLTHVSELGHLEMPISCKEIRAGSQTFRRASYQWLFLVLPI